MGTVTKRPRGRPPKTGGWQQLSVRLSDEWTKACDLLPQKHGVTLSEVMADAVAQDPLRALQVLSSYIPKNISVDIDAKGDFASALAQASLVMKSDQAKVIDIEEE